MSPNQADVGPEPVHDLFRLRVPLKRFGFQDGLCKRKIVVIHTEKDINKRAIESHSDHGEEAKRRAAMLTGVGRSSRLVVTPLVILQARAIFEALRQTTPEPFFLRSQLQDFRFRTG